MASRSTQIVEMLLQLDQVDVNCQDFKGHTPLMIAVISGDILTVEILLKHTQVAKLARDNEDNTAYSHAYWRIHQELDSSNNDVIIVLLEKYGCRPQILNQYEPTYRLAEDLSSDEHLNSSSGFRIQLCSSSTPFPTEDLTGPPTFHDTNGDPIYIGSAIFGTSIHPCKIEPHLAVPCSVPFSGRKIAHMECYDLLPFNPNTMEFVLMSQGHFPAGRKLVKGGYNQDGTPLYHGVATLNGIKIPGSISHHWYVLWFVRCHS